MIINILMSWAKWLLKWLSNCSITANFTPKLSFKVLPTFVCWAKIS